MIDTKTHTQLLRYGLVGLGSNLLLYLVYILLTNWGMEYKSAMTLMYAIGVSQTFLFNRSWSFQHQGETRGAFARYATSYILGYLLNFAGLWLAVGMLQLNHQIVQGCMILTTAALLFLLQKFWVFPDTGSQIELTLSEDQ